jgi:intein/homing endonuclease
MHFYDLFNALKDDCEFYLCHNTNKIWYLNTRPLPKNAHFVAYYEPGKYDFAILDVDQQLVNNDIGKRKIYIDLNNLIQDIPKVVINHGTPVYPEYCKMGDMTYKDSENIVIKEIKNLVGDNPMVVNSYESASEREWGWGTPIWHGMNPKDWVDLPKEPRIFTALSPGGCDNYYNREAMNEVSYILNDKYGYNLWWAKVNVDTGHRFEDYKNFLGASLIYLDTSFRTPMNRARTEAMMCLKPDSKVVIADDFSYEEIQNVKIGDKVINKDGKIKVVRKVYRKGKYNGQFYRIRVCGHEPIECSGKHRFWVLQTSKFKYSNGMVCKPNSKGGHKSNQKAVKKDFDTLKPKWVKASDIQKGDCILSPSQIYRNKNSFIDLSLLQNDKLDKRDGYIRYKGTRKGLDIVAKEFGINSGYAKERLRTKRYKGEKILEFINWLRKGNYKKLGYIKDKIRITPELARLIGYYIAEGSTHGTAIRFSFHRKETKYHRDVKELLDKLFGIKANIRLMDRNRAEVYCNNRLIAFILESICGKGANKKIIPKELVHSSNKILVNLIAGLYRGDGYVGNGADYVADYVTISTKLAYQVYFILKVLGIHGTITKYSAKNSERMNFDRYSVRSYGDYVNVIRDIVDNLKFNYRKHSGHTYFEYNGNWYYVVRSIKEIKYKGPVYDLAVDGHSYLVNGLSTHNSGCCVVQVKGAHDLDKFVKEGENMILVPNEPRQIAALLVDLIENHYKDCIEIGKKGKETAKKIFNYKRYRENWLRFIHDELKL